MSPIEDRLAASLAIGALEGNSDDRAVVASQIRQAIKEIKMLRKEQTEFICRSCQLRSPIRYDPNEAPF